MKYKSQINIDRLELTYEGNEGIKTVLSDKDTKELHWDGLRLVRQKSRMYCHEFVVLVKKYSEEQGIRERPLGYLYFGSPNPNRPYIYLLYDNASLYDDNMLALRFYVGEVLGLRFLRVSKLDIAIDYNFNITNRFYRLFKNPDYALVVNGKKITDVYEEVPDIAHIVGHTNRKRPFAHHSPVLKNSDGSLMMRSYDKSKEIAVESGKDYIADKAGFRRLYRLEVSMGNHKVITKNLKRLYLTDEELYERLQDERTLNSLFRSALNSLIRVSKGRKSHSILEYILPDGYREVH